jgi:hypothetical protein
VRGTRSTHERRYQLGGAFFNVYWKIAAATGCSVNGSNATVSRGGLGRFGRHPLARIIESTYCSCGLLGPEGLQAREARAHT